MAISTFPAVSAPAGKSEQTVIINSTQSWTAPTGVSAINLLLVGAGGGGGYDTLAGIVCGGGGGGGVVHADFAVTEGTSYTVTIGAGGAQSTVGGNSTFSTIVTARGGGGGASGEGRGGAGGCGGGNSSRFGDANYIAAKRGGGGGGAGELTLLTAANGTGIGIQGGHGHPAVNSSDSASVAGGAAYLGRFGGGGGGCFQGSVNINDTYANLPYGGGYPMSGGMGGHSHNQTGALIVGSGVANSGGGGGGGGYTAYGFVGNGNGGSGVCIIKYWA